MFKHIAEFCFLFFVLLTLSSANDELKTKKKKKTHSHSRVSRYLKATKHSRKSRRYHHGNGPSLKTITTDSPYKEDPTNGVNPIETKQSEK